MGFFCPLTCPQIGVTAAQFVDSSPGQVFGPLGQLAVTDGAAGSPPMVSRVHAHGMEESWAAQPWGMQLVSETKVKEVASQSELPGARGGV